MMQGDSIVMPALIPLADQSDDNSNASADSRINSPDQMYLQHRIKKVQHIELKRLTSFQQMQAKKM